MTIQDASTVMLLRERSSELEVFMVKRHASMAFMANAFVYPGGKLDAADLTSDMIDHIEGAVPEDLASLLRVDSPSLAVGLYLAAIRETFEEAGVLLARRRGEDDWVDLVGDKAEAFLAYRAGLNDGSMSLAEVAEREDLVFPLDRLGFLAQWVTPPFSPTHRFDTRFFVARAPSRQVPLHDTHETTESRWIRPRDALDLGNEDSEFYLSPPTERTMAQLAVLGSVDAVFAYVVGRTPPKIMSHLDTRSGTPILLFPGDPDFPELPEYSELEPVDDGVTRMVLKLPRES